MRSRDMGKGPTQPWFAALGIVSAPQYKERRDQLRSTWLSSPHAARSSGDFLCRFVIAWPTVSVAEHGKRVPRGNTSADLESERERHKDMLVFASRATGRTWGPIVTTYLWFTHAARTLARTPCAYVGKLDDDVYVGLGTLLAQLRLVRTQLGESAHVYYGATYWTMYSPEHFQHVGSRYVCSPCARAETARRTVGVGRARESARAWRRYSYALVAQAGDVAQTCAGAAGPVRRPNGSRPFLQWQCVGPFPFTTGSMQMISSGLLELLAASPGAAAHIERAVALANTDGADGKRRRAPAYEDVWLGYAVRALLPADTRVHIVHLDKPAYYHDRWGLTLPSSTFLYHSMPKIGPRIAAVASFSAKYHCDGAPALLECSTKPWRAASLRADVRALDAAAAAHGEGRASGGGTAAPRLPTKVGAHSPGNASVVYRECLLHPAPAGNLSKGGGEAEGAPRCASRPVVVHDLKRTCSWPHLNRSLKLPVC